MRWRLAVVLCVLVLVACDGPGTNVDGGTDAGPRERHPEMLPAPTALQAGVAEVRIPAPLGIGTMGFGAFGADPSPTPFAENFPGTTRMHGALTFRAIALSRGPAFELILVRMDTVGVFQQLREAVLDELSRRLGRSVDDSLILAGNHTHSGPGRILMSTGALTALADTFFPEFYDAIVDALADVVEQAIGNQAPAELGYTIVRTSAGHSDRRCENDPLAQPQEIPDMPVIAVRRGGVLSAIVASYAYHGTVLGIDQLTLCGDVGSAVEQKIEERFDHPVMVLFFNSWGADMAPSNPSIDPTAIGAEQPGGYDRMERIGEVVADAIVPALDSITFEAEPTVRARTYRVPIDREAIGYDDETFRYTNGGVFCGAGAEGNCVDVQPIATLDTSCLPISRTDGLPHQTMISAGQIGNLHFVTGSGEWGTALANGVLDHVRARTSGDAMFLGYANDYTGYSLGEADWWQGGYEASGALWGPRQGDYLAARTVEAFDTFFDLWIEPPWIEPERVAPFSGYTYEPYVPERGSSTGTFALNVAPTVATTDVVQFTLLGSDPWLGTPVATLERDTGAAFEAVVRGNGELIDSESYDYWIDLATAPTYAEIPRTEERTFSWTFHFPVSRRAASNIPALTGTYRFRVRVPTVTGEMTVYTDAFVVP